MDCKFSKVLEDVISRICFVPSMNTAFKDVNLKVRGAQEIYEIEPLLILMITQSLIHSLFLFFNHESD